MIKIKKDFNLKTLLLIVTAVFLFTNVTYGIELPGEFHLRVPALGNSEEGRDREKYALAAAAHSGESEEKAKAELVSLIKAGNIVTYEQALRYLEQKSRSGELELHICANLLAMFNNLVEANLTDAGVRNVAYIEIEGENRTLHKIEITQSEKFFTAGELLEIIKLLKGLPINIRACIRNIERVRNSQVQNSLTIATAIPQHYKIVIPDAFYSYSLSNGNGAVTYVRNEANRRGTFVHEVFELYVTRNSLAFMNDKLIELDKIRGQLGNPSLSYLKPILLGLKKDLESTLFIRWIRVNGYTVDKEAFYEYLNQSKEKEERYILSWIAAINIDKALSGDAKQELIEIFELVGMFTSCSKYADVWRMNMHGTSSDSINPSEDLVEACLFFLLDGSMYRQKAGLACKLQKDTTPLISYLVLRNGPFEGKEYGRDPEGGGISVSYIGDSARGDGVYHIQGTMRYSKEHTEEVNVYAFVPNNKTGLIGRERTISLHTTTEIAATIPSRELLNRL